MEIEKMETKKNQIKWKEKRPLLYGEDTLSKIKKLYAQRKNIYKLAQHRINCNNLNKEIISKKIISIYEKQ